MISIIDYDKKESGKVAEILTGLNADFIITVKEAEITGSDKIILPDSEDISKISRKLQLYNLFSLLRMIRKPILGLNNGMLIMCSKIEYKVKGVGIFPVDSEKISKAQPGDRINEFILPEIVKNTPLLSGIKPNEDKFHFSSTNYIPLNEFASSRSTIHGKDAAVTMEKGNSAGVQLFLDNSPTAGNIILKNFVNNI